MNEEPIHRAEYEEYKRRTEEESIRQDKRLSILESSITQVNSIAISVEKLAQSVQQMCKEQEKQGQRLERLEGKDGEMWRKVISTAVTAIIGGIIGYGLSHIGL